MKKSVSIAAIISLLVAIFCVVLLRHTHPSNAHKIVKLHLGNSRSASQIELPAGMSWAGYTLDMHDVHVMAELPGARSYEFDLRGLLIEQTTDGLVQSITFVFDADSIENAHTRATNFARDWGLPTTKFDDWQTEANRGKWEGDTIQVIDNTHMPGVVLEILDSYEETSIRAARVSFELGWY